jgi:hypothetical protein
LQLFLDRKQLLLKTGGTFFVEEIETLNFGGDGSWFGFENFGVLIFLGDPQSSYLLHRYGIEGSARKPD